MSNTKTVYVVRKHITDAATGADLRYKDYPNQFDTPELATLFLEKKEEKYRQTISDYMDAGEEYFEGRRYEIVPIQVAV